MLVLIVDDEPVVAQTLAIIFRRSGFSAEIVHSADDALAFVAHTPPDLILCDFEVPDRDGLALLEELCEQLPNCRMLILTGAYGSLPRIRSFASACTHAVSVMTKPCRPTDLLRAANLMLENA